MGITMVRIAFYLEFHCDNWPWSAAREADLRGLGEYYDHLHRKETKRKENMATHR